MTRLKRLNGFIKAMNKNGWTPNTFQAPLSDYSIFHEEREYIIDADTSDMNFFDVTSGIHFSTDAKNEYNDIDDEEFGGHCVRTHTTPDYY